MGRPFPWQLSMFLSRDSASHQLLDSLVFYCERMINWEVRSTSETLGAAYFGGKRIRRVPIALAGQQHFLLLHEDERTEVFLLREGGSASTGHAAIQLHAEWGEPLGAVKHLEVDATDGRVQAYLVQVGMGEALRVEVADTYWWYGDLYCRKRRAGQLRDLIRQASRARQRNRPDEQAA